MRERLQHLAVVEELPSANSPEFARWADTRLDRWLIDWALRNGKEKTARMIAQDRGVEVLFLLTLARCMHLLWEPSRDHGAEVVM